MEKILQELQPIFQDVFDDENLIVTKELSAADVEDWDSLAQIRIVAAMEKHFNIKFAFGELKELKNVGEMITVIQGKITSK